MIAVLRFKTEEEAIALASNTEHGLAAGIVWVNSYRVISPIAEFGAMKHSGYGCESGFQAVMDYTRLKAVWMTTSDSRLASQFVSR